MTHLLVTFLVGSLFSGSANAEDWAGRLGSPEPTVRSDAEAKLLEMGRDAVPVCIGLVANPSLAVRLGAGRLLRKLGDKGLVSSRNTAALRVPLLDSKEPELRAAFYALLARSEPEASVELLLGLADTDRGVRTVVLEHLASLKQRYDPNPCISLLAELEPDDPLVPAVLRALRAASAAEDTAPVVRLLTAQAPGVAESAAQVLGSWKASASAPALAQAAFGSARESVHEACFEALGAVGPPGLKEVIARSKDTRGPVRVLAAAGLAHFPDAPTALTSLLEKDPYPRVRQEASRSLQRLAGLAEDKRYFLRYDATEGEQQEVIQRWKAYWQDKRLAPAPEGTK